MSVSGGKWPSYGANAPFLADSCNIKHASHVDDDQINNDRCEVVFKDVCFQYPTRPDALVLKNFNLVIKPKQTVALVGCSGSGKSTTLILLERFYDVCSGSICIDGTDIRKLDPRWLHHTISVVPQVHHKFVSKTIYILK